MFCVMGRFGSMFCGLGGCVGVGVCVVFWLCSRLSRRRSERRGCVGGGCVGERARGGDMGLVLDCIGAERVRLRRCVWVVR